MYKSTRAILPNYTKTSFSMWTVDNKGTRYVDQKEVERLELKKVETEGKVEISYYETKSAEYQAIRVGESKVDDYDYDENLTVIKRWKS